MTAQRSTSRDLALIAIFAGVMSALGLVPAIYLPLTPGPITAQSFGVMLTGAILGGRRAAASMTLFLGLVAIGLPLLAGGRGTIGVFAGPSVGFLLGWIVVAWLIGVLTARAGAPYRLPAGIGINLLGGVIVLYAVGIVGMLLRTQMTVPAAVLANAPYIPGDIVKAVLAAVIAKGVHTAYPGLLRVRRPARARA